jgi:CheY-like chemotaxis protein
MSASILIVDDDPQVTRVCEIALKQAGYSVATVEDGRKALEALTTLDFDVILLDLVMPEMDGLEFLRELLKAKSEIKVVAMSGMFEGQFLNAARLLGAKAILSKPFSQELLLQVIYQTLTAGSGYDSKFFESYLNAEIELSPSLGVQRTSGIIWNRHSRWKPVKLESGSILIKSTPENCEYRLRFEDLEHCQDLPERADAIKRAKWTIKGTIVCEDGTCRLVKIAGVS